MRRLAESRDLEAVHAIYMDGSVVPFLSVDPMPIDEFRDVFRELVDSRCFYVFEVAEEVAGFYKAARRSGRTAHVATFGSLAVAPKFQAQGVARRMVVEAMVALRREGVKRIELTVESDNLRGIAFYERLGFEREGTLRKFYKRSHESAYVDDYVMAMVFE